MEKPHTPRQLCPCGTLARLCDTHQGESYCLHGNRRDRCNEKSCHRFLTKIIQKQKDELISKFQETLVDSGDTIHAIELLLENPTSQSIKIGIPSICRCIFSDYLQDLILLWFYIDNLPITQGVCEIASKLIPVYSNGYVWVVLDQVHTNQTVESLHDVLTRLIRDNLIITQCLTIAKLYHTSTTFTPTPIPIGTLCSTNDLKLAYSRCWICKAVFCRDCMDIVPCLHCGHFDSVSEIYKSWSLNRTAEFPTQFPQYKL